jgi:hypothetical protein
MHGFKSLAITLLIVCQNEIYIINNMMPGLLGPGDPAQVCDTCVIKIKNMLKCVHVSYFLYMFWMSLQQLFEYFQPVYQSLGVIKAVDTQHNFLVCEYHL